jgi:mono/diheme cytochrome c family protein
MPPAVPIQDDGHGLIMPDFGPDATHLDYGEEVYRLVCKACHGDKGQGLTPDWIAQWAPEDQNCWQTKCHAANHPPEGFILPTYVPPSAGPQFIARWQNGRQLHDYIRTAMPWHAPGTLEDDEYWQATAWVLALNGVDVGRDPLDNTRAEVLRLSAAQPQATMPADASMRPQATRQPETTPIPGIYATRQADIAAEKAIEAASQQGFPWGWVALMVFSVAGLTWIIAQFLRR